VLDQAVVGTLLLQVGQHFILGSRETQSLKILAIGAKLSEIATTHRLLDLAEHVGIAPSSHCSLRIDTPSRLWQHDPYHPYELMIMPRGRQMALATWLCARR
jgi:hypothetical protein